MSLGESLQPQPDKTYPVRVKKGVGLEVQKSSGECQNYGFREGLGVVCLRPLTSSRLELFLWGFDEAGLKLAARLAPTLTGVGQPDFVVVQKRMAWQGPAGVLGMGFFDNSWRLSETSFLL